MTRANHGDMVGLRAVDNSSNKLPIHGKHPESAGIGEMYFNSEHKCAYIYTGDEWSALSKRPSHIKEYTEEFRL